MNLEQISWCEGINSRFQISLKSHDVISVFRKLNTAEWLRASSLTAYLPVSYSNPMIEYQLEYLSGTGNWVCDLSVIIYDNNRPCAIWPLSVVRNKSGDLKIRSGVGGMQPPLFIGEFAKTSHKSIISKTLEALNEFCRCNGIPNWECSESFVDEIGVSHWHDKLNQLGAPNSVQYENFIRLDKSLLEIKAGFRKSYKSLISQGEKMWQIICLDMPDLSVWNEFRSLHISVAGRETRSLSSWEIQHEAITSGSAFLVYLRNDAGRMIGGGFFNFTKDECDYSVGAYDRTLFKSPLGHAVQYYAIKEMLKRQTRWYRLGACHFEGVDSNSSEKEVSISNFKRGFASHCMPVFSFKYEVSGPE